MDDKGAEATDWRAVLLANIGAALEERGWNHAEYARRTGVSQATISKVFNGSHGVALRTLVRFARPFGVLPGDLLRPQGEKDARMEALVVAKELSQDEAAMVRGLRAMRPTYRHRALGFFEGLLAASQAMASPAPEGSDD